MKTHLLLLILASALLTAQQPVKVEQVELQPLTAQVKRLVEAMDYLGAPLKSSDKEALERASHETDATRANRAIQDTLDKYCLADIHINPESRVKVTQGAAKPELVEKGWRAFLVKVRNEAGVTAALRAESPNALAVYATSRGNPRPPQRVTQRDVTDRWLDLAMFNKPPLKPPLSGLELEYRIIHLYSRDAGKREAKISFNVGQGTQDIGFRNDVDILFNCQPAVDVTLRVMDERGKPTTASFIIRDAQGFVYPPRTKRLAPDFDFHPQVYRADGEKIKLPAGEYTVEYTRGPEYLVKHLPIKISNRPQTFTFKLERWIDLARLGWYSGDHHVHAAGCAHYESPTEGVSPEDMIRHILGESLNVGSVLTWGPCYYYQKQFFEAKDNQLSTSENLMRYDLEVSGFPSSHCGHLVLLRLKEQDYPGAKVLEDWPTWDLPILQWAKRQGAITGFAHSGWGLEIKDSFDLPSYELPKFDGIGANEYIVDVTHDAVDFISTVDTPAPWELNIWYHTLNTGFRTRISGETDFPCIYGERVGLGRSYVKLDKLSYDGWAEGVRDGRTYVSDGKSHLIDFRVNEVMVGTQKSELKLDKPQAVRVTARVAARLGEQPNEAISKLRYNQKPYWDLERARIGSSREVPVELIVNGLPVAKKIIPADGQIRELAFDAKIERSSWVALRIPVSSHTNPIFVIVGDKPIRASRRSAEWCLKAVDQCWSQKAPKIAAKERDEAAKAYEHARQAYRRILAESEID
ncbi:MAG: CehA/McbA family metallohydrolase [Blastocatellia bacterium]